MSEQNSIPNHKLPNLPGYSVSSITPDEAAYHKTQTLMWKNGYSVVAHPPIGSLELGPSPSVVDPASVPTATPATAPTITCTTKGVPKWIQYENQVLRFYAYFKEDVHNSAEETWRARKVCLLYYLEDDTVQITEPKIGGIQHGTILSRQLVYPKKVSTTTSDKPLAVDSFTIGATVTIFNTTYSIVDADAFTRDFLLKQSGKKQPTALPYPTNPYDALKAERQKPSGLSRTDPQNPTRFAEILMGKAPSSKKLQQFLEGNNQVLRFYCVWDDETGDAPVRRPYKLHYFLEDDSIEVLEIQDGSGGREFYNFLKRAPLPKQTKATGVAPGELLPEDAYYRPSDFHIGHSVNIHGRQFLLHDADAWTKSWLSRTLHRTTAELSALDVSQPSKPLPKNPIPAHNGYGSPDDSKQNCIKLIPTQPKKDFKLWKIPGIERVVLQFTTKLIPLPDRKLPKVESERRFVFSFYAADDTVSVYEPPVPNSGVVGGKYLERSKVYKPNTEQREWYRLGDMKKGAVLHIHGRLFELGEPDDFTRHYLDQSQSQ